MGNLSCMSSLGLIVYCGTVPSTQELAREILQAPPVHIRAVVADHQTAGRGRHGNRWIDTPGESLLMTMLLRLEAHEVPRSGQLAFVLALAVADALQELAKLETRFKWSNDLLVGGRKVGGILIETAVDSLGNHWALAGVGVNLLQHEFPPDLHVKATSVWLESGRAVPMEPLAQEILRLTDEWLQRWRQEGFARVLAAWKVRDVTAGQRYLLPSGEVVVAQGVNERGELLVELQGETRSFTSAEPVTGTYGSDAVG